MVMANNGQFRKGHNKKGGRKKGTPNKATSSIKERIKFFVDNNFEMIENDIRELEPSERIRFYLKLMEFVLPKQKHMDIDAPNNLECINVVFKSAGIPPVTSESQIEDI